VELAEKPVSCSAKLLKTLSRVLSYISVCTATPKDPKLPTWPNSRIDELLPFPPEAIKGQGEK
jgi:hypothetical protein